MSSRVVGPLAKTDGQFARGKGEQAVRRYEWAPRHAWVHVVYILTICSSYWILGRSALDPRERSDRSSVS
jgi:hypothetical protein